MKWGFKATADPERLTIDLAPAPPAATGIPLVSLSRSASCAVMLAGRLFHRPELLRALSGRMPPPGAESAASGDAALALSAYAHFGPQGLARLEGDFCVLVFDFDKCRFIARRDPLGAYPLFWARTGRVTCFSTALGSVRTQLATASFDLEYIADFLAGTSHANPRAREVCIYNGGHRVDTDEIVSIDIDSGHVSKERCWDWCDQVVDPGTDRPEEIAGIYAPLLRHAVRERIGSRTGCHLSGGMDSTSVCLLALAEIQAGAGTPPLHSFSLVYDRLPTLAKEAHFIDLVLDGDRKDLVGHRVAGDDVLHFDIFRDLPAQDEPSAELWALGPDRAVFAAAGQLGVDTMLTGDGADDFMVVTTDHLTDLISDGRWMAAWRSAVAWAQMRRSNPWTILRQHAIADGRVDGPLGWLGRILQIQPPQLAETADMGTPAWISADFARRHCLVERAAARASQFQRAGQPAVMSRVLEGLALRSRELSRSAMATPLGIHFSHPFLDQRAIGLGIGIKQRLHAPHELQKPVLAEAMRGVLPEEIRTRRTKRPFNELLFHGYRRNQDILQQLIRNSPFNELGIFDHKIMIKCLEEAALGIAMPYSLRRLNELLSLLAWGSSVNRPESHAPVQRLCIPLRPLPELVL